MKEIKFRAWVIPTKRNELIANLYETPFMVTQGEADVETFDSFMFHYRDEKNLMQYIGLKDKNGKEIYEGDIITVLVFDSNQECTVTEVKFVKYNSCSFDVYNPDGTWEIFLEDVQEDCEIIGNIYEHTYLLTTKLNKTLSGDKK